jgi:hypothetical protein
MTAPEGNKSIEAVFASMAELTGSLLQRGTDVDSCVAAARVLNRTLEDTISTAVASGAPVACQNGCSFCCYLRVELFAPESIAIFRYLNTEIPEGNRKDIRERIFANAERIAGLTVEEHRRTNVQCAFLVDGHCSIYPVRPIACSGHHSCDVRPCEQAYQDPSVEQNSIPMDAMIVLTKDAVKSGEYAAISARGLRPDHTELHTTLASLLRNPALIGQWRNRGKIVKA